jgi:hypothetical protein
MSWFDPAGNSRIRNKTLTQTLRLLIGNHCEAWAEIDRPACNKYLKKGESRLNFFKISETYVTLSSV